MAVDNDGNIITLQHVMGEGDWETPNKQAAGLPRPLLAEVAKLGIKAFNNMQPSGPVESYLDVFQGPQESFLQFIERLTVAVERQEEDELAREKLVTSLAFKHANQLCKQAMLTLPRNPRPTLRDYIEVVTEVVPLMTPGRPEKRDHRRTTISAAAVPDASSQPNNTAVPARTPRPAWQPSRGAADRPCALCGQRGHWWQACPLRKEFQEFKQNKGGGGGGVKGNNNQVQKN